MVGLVRMAPGGYILTVTEQGKGYLAEPEDYSRHHRGGKGLVNYRVTEESGCVVSVLLVELRDDVMAIADDGVIIRICARDIRICRRPAGGVWVMRPNEGAKVVTIARAAQETPEPEAIEKHSPAIVCGPQPELFDEEKRPGAEELEESGDAKPDAEDETE